MKTNSILQNYESAKIIPFIHLDTNIFKLLKRDPIFWNNFFSFFERTHPGLFDNACFIFDWSQLLEENDLGSILGRNIALWQKQLIQNNALQTKGISSHTDALEHSFNLLCDAVKTLPELQPAVLLAKIDQATAGIHPQAQRLCDDTLLTARKRIANNQYIDDLSAQITWAFMASDLFIACCETWIPRKEYLAAALGLWQRLLLKGHELDLYRIFDKHYSAFIDDEGEVIVEEKNLDEQNTPHDILLQPDMEYTSPMIHYSILGMRKHPVMSITLEEPEIIAPRIAISRQSLLAMKDTFAQWKVDALRGQIISLTIDWHTKQITQAVQACCGSPLMGKTTEACTLT